MLSTDPVRSETANLCLCSTHLQLVNIVEYIAYAGLSDNHLIVLESPSSDREITAFAREHYTDYFASIIEVKRPDQKAFKSNPWRWWRSSRRFVRQLQTAIDGIGKPIGLGVFGHGVEVYLGTAYRYAGRPPVVMVDDGTNTYRYLTEPAFRERLRRKNQQGFKRFLYASDCSFIDRARFFTLVDPTRTLADIEAVQNPYRVMRTMLGVKLVRREQHIVGQHLVEIAAMTPANYRAQIDAIVSAFEGPSYYFPHPGERAENLKAIAAIPGLELVETHLPYELYFLQQDGQPRRLVSFCTTAFITLSSWVREPGIGFFYVDITKQLKRPEIVERAEFAYSFSRDNPQLQLVSVDALGEKNQTLDSKSATNSTRAN